MAKFRVKVKIIAECEYTLDVEHETDFGAEDAALNQWRDKLPSDFQVDKGYITGWETEAEQQTAVCPDCGLEHTLADANCWPEDPDYCKPCGAKIEAEESR